jgi:hypothetical protein
MGLSVVEQYRLELLDVSIGTLNTIVQSVHLSVPALTPSMPGGVYMHIIDHFEEFSESLQLVVSIS